MVLNILMTVAQWERETIGERTRDALRYKKTQHQRIVAEAGSTTALNSPTMARPFGHASTSKRQSRSCTSFEPMA